MSCLREVQTISKSPDILPMPSLTRLTTGGVLKPLKNTTNTSHNELLHQDPLQPPLEPRDALDSLGFDRKYEDYRDLLADPEVDTVSIVSPNFLHHEIALAAIEAGKPFWIDKPMGINAA